MKNIDQLIEYVQRELNTKRFLDESLGFLEGLRGAKTEAAEAEKLKARAIKEKSVAEAELADVNNAVGAAKGLLATLAEQGKAVTDAASVKASEIIAKAEAEATAQMQAAQAQLDEVLGEIKSAQLRHRSIVKENNELATSTSQLQAGLDALKKKLG